MAGSSQKPPARPEMPTLTDAVALEAARIASSFATPPTASELREAEQREASAVAELRASLGSFDQVAVVRMSPSELIALKLEPRAALFLSLVDGRTSIEGLLEVSGMVARETLSLLHELRRSGAVALHVPVASRETAVRSSAAAPFPPQAYRVIAEGVESAGSASTIGEALAVLADARARGMRFVAIVDESTGALVDEAQARVLARR